MEKHWYDERTWEDAPVYFTMEASDAWADGYNAAVRETARQFVEALAKEQGK